LPEFQTINSSAISPMALYVKGEGYGGCQLFFLPKKAMVASPLSIEERVMPTLSSSATHERTLGSDRGQGEGIINMFMFSQPYDLCN
jgi:hypothetical protein